MAALPYITATGNVEKALLGIKAAATPNKVTQDFVKTILKIPGGSGDQMNSLLKKIGFVNSDGTPSDIYKRFRNNTAQAAAEALRVGYSPLFRRNEYWPAMSDDDLRGLIIEETGQDASSPLVTMILNTIKGIKKFGSSGKEEPEARLPSVQQEPPLSASSANTATQTPALGLNLGYTINLNLPATSDIAVFNAIFKSLKENLLKGSHED
jgi:hypothetical protein